jgi:hypothetical protein
LEEKVLETSEIVKILKFTGARPVQKVYIFGVEVAMNP